jgi:deazaflavin-dependent oxidoreductase (nitroreductase family)
MNRPRWFVSIFKAFTQLHIILYRLSKGRLLGKNTILITTIGRKSGEHRTHPLFAVQDGNDHVIIASYGGAPKHPAWYLNLLANPHVTVEDHGKTIATTASTVSDEAEYKRLWSKMTAIYAPYDAYQHNTERKIPVVLLSPIHA